MPVARPERVHRQVIREPQLIAGRHLLGSDGERQMRDDDLLPPSEPL